MLSQSGESWKTKGDLPSRQSVCDHLGESADYADWREMDTERELESGAPESESMLRVPEAAKRLGLSQQTVRRLFDAGELEGRTNPWSGYRFITPESVDALYLRMQGKTG